MTMVKLVEMSTIKLILAAEELVTKARTPGQHTSRRDCLDMIEALARHLADHTGYQGPGYNMSGGPNV